MLILEIFVPIYGVDVSVSLKASQGDVSATPISQGMTLLLACACGLLVANLYYGQPLVAPIRLDLGMPASMSGLIVTLTQIGYGLGLLLIVPLGDLIENKRLILVLIAADIIAVLCAATATQMPVFLGSALAIGLSSVAVQVLVPLAAHMAPEHMRGRVVGNVTSGLMLGIMFARPVAGFIAQISHWNIVFYMSAAILLGLSMVLLARLPERRPQAGVGYVTLIATMFRLLGNTPLLRRRALYQACMFGAFSVFWTTAPLYLADKFGLNQGQIALFALAGVAGAVASPLAGRVADRGWTKPATAAAICFGAIGLLLTHVGALTEHLAIGVLTISAIVLDFGVSANLTLGQRTIFGLWPEYRSRMNGIFMALFFTGGALGSWLGAWIYTRYGWDGAMWFALALPGAAMLYFLTEPKRA